MYLENRYFKALNRLKINITELSRIYCKNKSYFWADAFKDFVLYGITPNEYISFDFYKLSRLEKRE